LKVCFSSFWYIIGGVWWFKAFITKKDILIVYNYHNFSRYNNFIINRGSILKSNYAKKFERQIKFLSRHFNFCYPEEFFSKQVATKMNILITFDDGYRDNYQLAFPILKKYNAKAIFFLATNYIGTENWLWHDRVRYLVTQHKIGLEKAENILKKMNRGHEIPKDFKELVKNLSIHIPPVRLMMSWEEVSELAKEGFKIGGHTENHMILPILKVEEQESEIKNSLQTIKKKIGVNCESFACPNGLYDQITINILKQNNIHYAFTTDKGINTPDQDPLKIKRIGINAADSISFILLKLFLNRFI